MTIHLKINSSSTIVNQNSTILSTSRFWVYNHLCTNFYPRQSPGVYEPRKTVKIVNFNLYEGTINLSLLGSYRSGS